MPVAGSITTGDVWSFTTVAELPQAVNPTPRNGGTNVSVGTSLNWDGVTGADTYRVYIGYQPEQFDRQWRLS